MSTPLRTPSALEMFRITFSNQAIPGKARGYFPEDFRKQGSFIVLTGSRAYSYADEEHRGGKEQAKLLEAGALKRAGDGEYEFTEDTQFKSVEGAFLVCAGYQAGGGTWERELTGVVLARLLLTPS
jgi:hypothetical protein